MFHPDILCGVSRQVCKLVLSQERRAGGMCPLRCASEKGGVPELLQLEQSTITHSVERSGSKAIGDRGTLCRLVRIRWPWSSAQIAGSLGAAARSHVFNLWSLPQVQRCGREDRCWMGIST